MKLNPQTPRHSVLHRHSHTVTQSQTRQAAQLSDQSTNQPQPLYNSTHLGIPLSIQKIRFLLYLVYLKQDVRPWKLKNRAPKER